MNPTLDCQAYKGLAKKLRNLGNRTDEVIIIADDEDALRAACEPFIGDEAYRKNANRVVIISQSNLEAP